MLYQFINRSDGSIEIWSERDDWYQEEVNLAHLTHCILVDASTVICWTSPFAILEMLGLFCHFYSIFGGKPC